MKRIIVDYKKLNNEILNLVVDKYPDGYDYDDIISFKNANNEIVEAIEIRTEDVMYLVKVGVRLIEAMENHVDEDEDEDDENEDLDINENDADIEIENVEDDDDE
jgi:hypothetical protein